MYTPIKMRIYYIQINSIEVASLLPSSSSSLQSLVTEHVGREVVAKVRVHGFRILNEKGWIGESVLDSI